MPIYEYRCDDCGTSFEKLVRTSDGSSTACPSCGRTHLTLQLSTFSAHSGASPSASKAPMGGCPAGMCRTPELCGRN